MKKLITSLSLLMIFMTLQAQSIDVQGHRGCRGLMPENTIEGFIKALDLGVTTLELDVVITKDHQVLVSHEPFMAHNICLDREGNEITEKTEKTHNIYEMDYVEILKYDCGTKVHADYPEQDKFNVHKPLLADVIDAAEKYIKKNKLKEVDYNIEIKRKPENDGIFHPQAEEFTKLVLKTIEDKGILERTILQCFDLEVLRMVHEKKPDLRTALLIYNQKSFKKNVNELGYIPTIYSPHFKRVDKKMMKKAKKKSIKVIPWTVNDKKDIQKMLDFGVDGIISDYPNRVFDVLNKK